MHCLQFVFFTSFIHSQLFTEQFLCFRLSKQKEEHVQRPWGRHLHCGSLLIFLCIQKLFYLIHECQHFTPLHGYRIIYLIISYLGTSKLFSDFSWHKQYSNEMLVYKSLVTSVFHYCFTQCLSECLADGQRCLLNK